jgi:hypothetical protein
MCKSLLLICIISFAWMQSLYPLHSMPITGRDLSFSGGGGAIKSEQTSLNPSAINSSHKDINIHTQLLPAGISLLSLNATYPKNNIIYFVSISNLNFGKLKDGNTDKTFSASDLMINGGLKRNLYDRISVGASISYTLSLIANNVAQSVLFSTGFRTEISEDRIGFGLTLRNLGIQFDHFRDTKESIPFQLQTSAFIRPQYLSAVIFSDVVMEQNIDDYIIISGIEFFPREGLMLRISDSVLYNNRFKLNGLAFGIQLNLKKWTINLASRNLVSAGFINGVTLSKQF